MGLKNSLRKDKILLNNRVAKVKRLHLLHETDGTGTDAAGSMQYAAG